VTSAKILDGTITNADISGTAAIVTTKISGLGSLATVTPTGTANNTTFSQRVDNTWAAAGGSGEYFSLIGLNASWVNHLLSARSAGGGNTTIYSVVAGTMPAPCTFGDLYLTADANEHHPGGKYYHDYFIQE